MTTEHNVLTDPEIHEPKGIISARAGHAYVADGAGSGSWRPVGAGSAWELLVQGAVNGGNSVTTITWDESDAEEILIVCANLRTQLLAGTDGISWQLGHTGGTVLSEQTHQFNGLYNFNVDEVTPWTVMSTARTKVNLLEGGIVDDDYTDATIELIGVKDPQLGAAFIQTTYSGIAASNTAEWGRGIVGSTNGAAPDFAGVIDTIVLTIGDNWAFGGTIKVYGLKG